MNLGAILICEVVGFLLALGIQSAFLGGNRDDCRAKNPGFDCSLGWVRGEPFK